MLNTPGSGFRFDLECVIYLRRACLIGEWPVEYISRFSGSWSPRLFGIGAKICCAILFGTFLLFPDDGYGQAFFGDPSLTLGRLGRFKLEVSAGVINDPNIKIDDKPISVTARGQSFDLIASKTTDEIKSEQFFLTATVGVGRSTDIFLKVGQFKSKNFFNGNFGPSGGLGFRFSPPQTGYLKMGLLMQASYATSENSDFGASFDTWFEPDSRGLQRHIVASGTAEDKLRLISYDLLLGVGVQNLSFVRPYAGLFVSSQNRTEKGSFSGRGDVFTCQANLCLGGVGPVAFSWNTDVSSDSIVGGVFGLTFTPVKRLGIGLEGHIGEGHLSSERGLMASAFVYF